MTARWARLTLRARLSLLAASAVAVAVLAIAGLAWLVVREELYRQLDRQLTADAQTIAAQPAQWRDASPPSPPGDRGERFRWYRGQRDIGTRWQILDAGGVPVGGSALPVTTGAQRVVAGTVPTVRERVDLGPITYHMLTMPATGGGAVQVAISRDPVDRTLGQLGLLLAVGCLAGVAGAALLGRSVARAGLAPVERLTGAVEHVAHTQDLRAAIPVSGEDEIARLARSFNAMLAALDSSRAAQRALVEDAGHELRTPLTSLRTNIELLIRADASGRPLSDEDRRRLLQDLEVQVVELTQLTNELVVLARQDTSPEPTDEVDLTAVVGAATQRARVRAPGVTFETALTPAIVMGQPAALERMVLNLLDNAAKWSPPGGNVRIELALSDGYAVLDVADAGPGIDDSDVPRVFERFYRATAARSMPGSGLGLAIVAQTVAHHGGAVTVGRSAEGGALLTVRLPAVRMYAIEKPSSDS
jgi:two-component system sensor histidine kinase MprB